MPKGKHIHRIVIRNMAVERDVTGTAEPDEQLTQFGNLRERSADFGIGF